VGGGFCRGCTLAGLFDALGWCSMPRVLPAALLGH
jgi:hypothetical protein